MITTYAKHFRIRKKFKGKRSKSMKFFKSVLTIHLFTISVALFSLIYSCSDDIIVSSSDIGFDSARFNWEFDTLRGSDFSDLYTPDTNNIFIISNPGNSIIRRRSADKKERYYVPFEEKVQLMIGDGIDNSYVCGFTLNVIGVVTYKPFIMKWTGSGFDKLPTNLEITIGGFDIYAGLYINPSEMWMACFGGRVLKYNGGDFEQSWIRDTTEPGNNLEVQSVFLDKQNIVKILAYYREVWYAAKYYYIFEYKDNNWELVYKKPPDESYPSRSIMNNNVVASGKAGVYSFDGQNFHKEVESYKLDLIQIVAGSSFSNFMITGASQNPPYKIFHWNGKKWSQEVFGYFGGDYRLNRVNDNYYVHMATYNGDYQMFIGRKK